MDDCLKISVITVCKNARRSLAKSIDSVFAQTYRNIEHIIIDGASTDDTVALLKEYEQRLRPSHDSSFASYDCKWISEPDDGIYEAMNKGIARASGDYLFFLNAGDVFHSAGVLEKVVSFIVSNGRGDLYHGLIEGGCRERQSLGGQEFREWSRWKLFFWTIPHPAVFYRRELFERFGLYDTAYRIGADYEFSLRVLWEEGVKHCYMPIVCVRFEEGGMSSLPENRPVYQKEMRMIRSRYFNGIYLLLNRFLFLEKVVRLIMKAFAR